jgi:hypothetical protein
MLITSDSPAGKERGMKTSLLSVALAATVTAEGCGCKRPSVVGSPQIVSYTFAPAPTDRLERARADLRRSLGARADDAAVAARARLLDDLAAAQEELRSGARSDRARSVFSRLICAGLGQDGAECVKSVRVVSLPPQARALGGMPEQYLVCLNRSHEVPEGARAASFLPPGLDEVGARLRPNIWWRMNDPRAQRPPSPDEKQAEVASRSNRDWAHKQIDYAGALRRLQVKRPGEEPGAGVVVAHLDTGYTSSCQLQKTPPTPSLVLQPAEGFDYFACRDDPADPLTEAPLPLEARQPGHGTGTSTILASPHVSPSCNPPEPNGADGHPEDRVVGIAPAAHVIPVRVTDGVILGFPRASKKIMELQGVSFDARARALAAGLYHAIQRHASVISMSLGGACADDDVQRKANEELQQWILNAESQGIVIVAAAGQYPMPGFARQFFFRDYPVTFPGSFPSSLAVAASSIYGIPWTQTSRGPKVDVTAPGFAVWRSKPTLGSPTPRDEITVGNGTSFSTAITAGVAAIWVQYWSRDWLQQRYGPATAAAFRLAVRRSAVQPADLDKRLKNEPYGAEIHRRVKAWDTGQYGAGLLDAARLLEVDLETITEDDVCQEEARRLGANNDKAWRVRYERICGAGAPVTEGRTALGDRG